MFVDHVSTLQRFVTERGDTPLTVIGDIHISVSRHEAVTQGRLTSFEETLAVHINEAPGEATATLLYHGAHGCGIRYDYADGISTRSFLGPNVMATQEIKEVVAHMVDPMATLMGNLHNYLRGQEN